MDILHGVMSFFLKKKIGKYFDFILLWKQEAPIEVEVVATPKNVRKRKTTHNDPSYGSFFLRVGAIGMYDFYALFVLS